MSKEYFIENISDETIVKMVDKALKFEKEKNNMSIKSNLFRLIPAVALIALVIGAANMFPAFMKTLPPVIDDGDNGGFTAGPLASRTEMMALDDEEDIIEPTDYVIIKQLIASHIDESGNTVRTEIDDLDYVSYADEQGNFDLSNMNSDLYSYVESDIDVSLDSEVMAIQNKLKDILSELKAILGELKASNEMTEYVGGEMMWPLDTEYNLVSSGFGYKKSPLTGNKIHSGFDIPAALGSNIYAANDGTVIIAESNEKYGNYMVIDHGGGKTTLYAQAGLLFKEVGDKVQKGDVIAEVGSTGWSTGNHLHFEYAENGQPKGTIIETNDKNIGRLRF